MDDEASAAEQDESMMMPGTSTEDTRTYDPTQGKGTDAWQQAVARQMELNAQLRRN